MARVNQVAIVTGAGRGLGAVVARVLAGRGFDLVLGAREPAPLLELAHALADAGGRVRVVAGDVTEGSIRMRLVDEAQALGGLHVLVNNASELGGISPLVEVDLKRLERVFAANVVAPLGLIQRAAPLLSRDHGFVVNVSSDAAQSRRGGSRCRRSCCSSRR